MMHDHDTLILTNHITLCKCAWCGKSYCIQLQNEEDINFCTKKCRHEWSNYINEYKEK